MYKIYFQNHTLIFYIKGESWISAWINNILFFFFCTLKKILFLIRKYVPAWDAGYLWDKFQFRASRAKGKVKIGNTSRLTVTSAKERQRVEKRGYVEIPNGACASFVKTTKPRARRRDDFRTEQGLLPSDVSWHRVCCINIGSRQEELAGGRWWWWWWRWCWSVVTDLPE